MRARLGTALARVWDHRDMQSVLIGAKGVEVICGRRTGKCRVGGTGQIFVKYWGLKDWQRTSRLVYTDCWPRQKPLTCSSLHPVHKAGLNGAGGE